MNGAHSLALLANATNSFGPGLLAATLAAPLVMLTACLSWRLRRHVLTILPVAPLPALAASLLALGNAPLVFEDPQFRVSLLLDAPDAMLLVVVALLWIGASAYAVADIRDKPNAERFAICWLLTLIGSLGVFNRSADVLSCLRTRQHTGLWVDRA